MNKKVSLIVIAMLVLMLALTGCNGKTNDEANDKAIFVAGTYEGEGKGHAGQIKVAVTVTDLKIESIEFVQFSESDFADEPAKTLIDRIIEANSGDVDVVAGASLTSSGVIEAVNEALALAYVDGANVANSNETTQAAKVLENKTTDVVIVGAGGAGLTAAIEAVNNGAKVIVVEKMPLIGGNTKYATGGLNAANTSVQTGLAIEDSADLFYEDTMKGGGEINNPELVRFLADHSAETVEWLIGIGADLTDVGRLAGASVDRAHRPTGGAPVGNHIVDVLYAEAQALGIEILLESEVVEVIGDSKAVSGVKVSTVNGDFTIEAKAVIIASGGFGANNELVASFDPALKGYGTTNHPGATGDVIEFGKNLDMAYVDMEQIQTHPTVMPSNNYMITEAVRGNGAILVNREALRFVNELETRAVVSEAQLAQTGASSFLVFDTGVRESLSAIDGYYKKGFLIEGATLEELAKKIEMDAAILKTTIETYNASVAAGTDAAFGREDMPRDLSVGPYYAVEVTPAIHHTMGGLIVNTNAEVVNNAGEVIKGLYAAGEVTGGVHGNNRLGGNALADITTFGRVAGMNAATSIK